MERKNFFSRLARLLVVVGVVALLPACSDDDNTSVPQEEAKGRTVLAYVWGDIDNPELCNAQLSYINKMEAGWNDGFDGSLYVYLDPSPGFVQFSKPVLLKIKHDNTAAIVSEIVREFEPIGKHGDIVRYLEVQNYVRSIAPAKSYGLMLFGHGSGALNYADDDETRGMGGNGVKNIENTELGETTLSGYDFVILHACVMGCVEAQYELRNKTKYIMASEISLESTGWPWDECLSYLYAQPNADLSRFVMDSSKWLYENMEEGERYVTLSLTDASQLENLAAATKKALNDNGVTIGQLNDNYNIYHYADNYSSGAIGLSDKNLNSLEFSVDFVEYMVRNGACTNEWKAAYDKACLLNQTYFNDNLKMYEEDEEGNQTLSFYNGLSVYASENYRFFESNNTVGYYLNGYKKHQWYTDSGFADIKGL